MSIRREIKNRIGTSDDILDGMIGRLGVQVRLGHGISYGARSQRVDRSR